MINIKEIRSKIHSIENICKITKAMEMISVSKMRKIYNIMLCSIPYIQAMRKVIEHVILGHLEYKHPYIIQRHTKSIGYFVVSTDHGLVGSLNTNLFKILLKDIQLCNVQGINSNFVLIGSKANYLMNYFKNKIVYHVINFDKKPVLAGLIKPIKIMLKLYDDGHIDKLFVVSNKYINTLVQQPCISQILPILTSTTIKTTNNVIWDYIYEPDSQILLNNLLVRYVESQVYQKTIENLVSEHAARMMAMKSASNNGLSLIKDLKHVYNKVRQNSITQEISEIISGTSVV